MQKRFAGAYRTLPIHSFKFRAMAAISYLFRPEPHVRHPILLCAVETLPHPPAYMRLLLFSAAYMGFDYAFPMCGPLKSSRKCFTAHLYGDRLWLAAALPSRLVRGVRNAAAQKPCRYVLVKLVTVHVLAGVMAVVVPGLVVVGLKSPRRSHPQDPLTRG